MVLIWIIELKVIVQKHQKWQAEEKVVSASDYRKIVSGFEVFFPHFWQHSVHCNKYEFTAMLEIIGFLGPWVVEV